MDGWSTRRNWIAMILVVASFFILTACGSDSTPDDIDGDGGDGDVELDGDSPADGDIDGDADGDRDDVVTEPTRFLAGYGEADLTPPNGTIMGAYGIPNMNRASVGVNDPLYAQVALVANDAGQAFMLITVDAAGYAYEFGDWGAPGIREVREMISAALADTLPIAPEAILISSSHSHTSTDLVGYWQDMDEGPDKDLLNNVANAITGAAVQAAESLQAATVVFTETELVGYAGRDNECSPTIDNSVMIIQARPESGDPIFTAINYAKHPTQIEWTDKLMSADFIWGVREEMKKQSGGPGMFVQGFPAAVHDGPRSHEVPGDDDYTRAYNMGKIIAETAIAALDANATPADDYAIMHLSKEYHCPSAGFFKDLVSMFKVPKRAFIEDEDGNLTLEFGQVSWHKVGPAEFASFPGEGSPEYSLELKGHMVSTFKFIVGLGNDELSYLIDPVSAAYGAEDIDYCLRMGPGLVGSEATMEAMESLGWYDGGWQSLNEQAE